MKSPEYIVLKDFADLQDNKYLYRVGNSFPRTGVDVGEERVAELASKRNKCGEALIAKVEVKVKNASKSESTVKAKEKKSRKVKKDA